MVKSLTTKTDNTEKRFLHLYRVVHEREKYLSTEALIVQYSTLLRFFVKFLQQKDNYNQNVELVLFLIYSKLGRIYYDESVRSLDNSKCFLAAEYYNQALSFARNVDDKTRILLALKDIYYYLNDEDAYLRVEETWAENHEMQDKYQAYMILAQNADTPHAKVRFLEKALNLVLEQKESFYEKYQDTLFICSQLVAVYELLGEREKALRVKKLRENTLKLLN